MSGTEPRAYDLTYLSLGAGVQSSALLVCSALGLHGVPRADVAIFADTQGEPRYVYDYLERLKAWAAPHGIPIETVTQGDLGAHFVEAIRGERKRASSIPCFSVTTNQSRGDPIFRDCTRDYKLVPIFRRVRQLLGAKRGGRVKGVARAMIGISLDEFQRMKPSRKPWMVNTWPLIDARLRREDCIRIVRDAGLPTPLKSACVFCPYHDDRYWAWMKADHPAEFATAVAFDDAIRDGSAKGVKGRLYLHQSGRPLGEIDFAKIVAEKDAEPLFDSFTNECEGMCGV